MLSRIREEKIEKVKIDKLDEKIIFSIFSDKRKTFKTIAKEVRSSNNVVKYRFDRMKKVGLLEEIIPIIDKNKLGYNTHSLYIKLQNLDSKSEVELIKKICSHPFVESLVTCSGNYDLCVLYSAKNITQSEKIMEEIQKNFSEYFMEIRQVTALKETLKVYGVKGNKKFSLSADSKNLKIDLLDLKLLKILSQQGYISFVEISNKMDVHPEKIRYRLKKLHENKIIIGYYPLINVGFLGKHWYGVEMRLKNQYSKRYKEFEAFLENEELCSYIQKSYGYWQSLVDFNVESLIELRKTIMKIKENFSDIIKDLETTIFFKDYTYNFLPVGVINELKKDMK